MNKFFSSFTRIAVPLALALATPGTALGALISVDDAIYGTGALTRDTETNLEWLDLEFSRGLAYNAVVTLYTEGTGFAGFRHATEAEVFTLLSHAGVPAPILIHAGDLGIPAFNQFMDLVTARFVNPAISTARNSQGFTSTPFPGTVWNSVPFVLETFSPIGSYHSGISAGTIDTPPAPNVGHWLVRVVPEPSSASLVMLCTVVLAGRRGRPAAGPRRSA